MIDIKSLPKPDVMQVLDYEEILNQNIVNFKTLVPGWIPLESDEFKLVFEAFAYREFHLRAEFNNLASAFFLSSSAGYNLDNYAVFYGVTRLAGSNPYATYEFSLSETLNEDVTISANLILIDANSKYEAKLLKDVIILAGELNATGPVELQFEAVTIATKTEIITATLPFVVEAKAIDVFANGSVVESDEDFRQRILLSLADKSTAGSEETYKSFTFNADERIEDVAVLNGDAGVVNVFYYSKNSDELMQTRIIEMLNKKEVRPLTDNIVVKKTTQISFNVTAELKILPNQETATVYSNAIDGLNKGLKALRQIGTDVTLSEINDFLKVSGVKEVVITEPAENIVVSASEIGVDDVRTISYTII